MRFFAEVFQMLTWQQILLLAIAAFFITMIILKIQKLKESRRFFEKQIEKTQDQIELKALMLYYFPTEAFHFEKHHYKRGMYIEIITKYHNLKGTIVGLNNNVLCIYNEGKITALNLALVEKIKVLKT